MIKISKHIQIINVSFGSFNDNRWNITRNFKWSYKSLDYLIVLFNKWKLRIVIPYRFKKNSQGYIQELKSFLNREETL